MTPCFVASHLGLFCLPMSHKKTPGLYGLTLSTEHRFDSSSPLFQTMAPDADEHIKTLTFPKGNVLNGSCCCLYFNAAKN